MPLKEQFARIWLITMLVTYAAYFAVVMKLGDTAGMWTQMGAFGVTAAVQATVIGIAAAIMKLRHKGGPETDERDRAVDQRATRVAYHILITGMIIVGCVMPFSEGAVKIFQSAVFFIALAEIVRHGMMVYLYQRGWHG